MRIPTAFPVANSFSSPNMNDFMRGLASYDQPGVVMPNQMAQYVPGNAAYIAAQRDQVLDRHAVVDGVGTASAAGPKPTQGMPNIPAIDTPLVLKVHRPTRGAC